MNEVIIARQCAGEGYGECDRCKEKTGWSWMWMCFLYDLEGVEGTYCSSCAKEIAREKGRRLEFVDRRGRKAGSDKYSSRD